MIHYQLCCGADHAFDGWFRDSAAFDEQARRGLIECPQCGDSGIRRALMAPAVPRKGRRKQEIVAPTPQAAAAAPEAGQAPAGRAAAAGTEKPSAASLAAIRLPDEVRAVLQRVRAEVEKHCEYVGDGFASEARRIHHGEVGARAIYGETSPEQAEALADEGIEVARIPWLPRADG